MAAKRADVQQAVAVAGKYVEGACGMLVLHSLRQAGETTAVAMEEVQAFIEEAQKPIDGHPDHFDLKGVDNVTMGATAPPDRPTAMVCALQDYLGSRRLDIDRPKREPKPKKKDPSVPDEPSDDVRKWCEFGLVSWRSKTALEWSEPQKIDLKVPLMLPPDDVVEKLANDPSATKEDWINTFSPGSPGALAKLKGLDEDIKLLYRTLKWYWLVHTHYTHHQLKHVFYRVPYSVGKEEGIEGLKIKDAAYFYPGIPGMNAVSFLQAFRQRFGFNLQLDAWPLIKGDPSSLSSVTGALLRNALEALKEIAKEMAAKEEKGIAPEEQGVIRMKSREVLDQITKYEDLLGIEDIEEGVIETLVAEEAKDLDLIMVELQQAKKEGKAVDVVSYTERLKKAMVGVNRYEKLLEQELAPAREKVDLIQRALMAAM